MTARLLPAGGHKVTPWKNGLGVTAEVAAFPPGADFEAFDWRVSMAQVDAGGPFSRFPSVDRVLAVLEGRLALRVQGRPSLELSRRSAPAAFPGDVDTDAALIRGPVRDLNIMTRRGRWTAELERLAPEAPTTLAVGAPTALLLCQAAEASLGLDGRAWRLAPDDALLIEDRPDAVLAVEPHGAATLYLARLFPTAPG